MSTPRTHRRAASRPPLWLAVAAFLPGCWWYGFQGGGLPAGIRTAAVLPFENETSSSELPLELADALREALERRLGLRPAPEGKADLVVRGKIRRYDVDIAVGVSADRRQASATRRRLAVGVDIELVNQRNGAILWQRTNLIGEGDYPERGEASGRKQALERIVADVIEGAQSQW